MKSYEAEPHDLVTTTPPDGENGELEPDTKSVEETEDVDASEFVASEGEKVKIPQRYRFVAPTREQLIAWAPFWGIILLGAILRFWGLGDKPLHHDESLHAYFSLQLMHDMENWASCFSPTVSCYRYDPLLHGPFQFHIIALVYKISQILGVYDHGVNTFTVRIPAATLGTVIVGLPYFLRNYLGKTATWLACFFLAVSPSMVYFSRFAREDIYMACFTLLLIVAVGCYVRSRKMRWLVIAALAFTLSYATKEATFLTVAVFGSFFVALIAWELGLKWPLRARVRSDAPFVKYLPRTGAPVAVLLYFVILAPIAKVLFGWMKNLSIYITASKENTSIADVYVQGLKENTVAIVPWIGIALGIYVLSILAREIFGRMPLPGRRGLAKKIDPEKQPLLDTIFTMPWIHWFFALLAGWAVFLILFTVLFTNIRGGIGDGIWQGLYYWLQQQQVARGGQPWYYYLLLIPLYEQVGLVFGLVGVVRCLLRPTRLRLFLVYWFLGNVFIYSWAAEKMPWLMIYITMPMMLLAAIGLEPAIVTVIDFVKSRFAAQGSVPVATDREAGSIPVQEPRLRPKVGTLAGITSMISVVLAVLLLVLTLHNMYEVTYVHAADGPHEMMIYVQTTTDVNIVMSKVDALDQKLYAGKHLLPIGLMDDATWPFAWYLRDYTNICFNFPSGCSTTAKNMQVIITGGDNLYTAQSQYGAQAGYAFHQYQLRSWWDEGYKPPACVPGKTNNCDGQPTWGGVGPWLWLSYGDNPPPNAKFDPGLAVKNVWQWWWERKAIGSTDGAYDMGLFIRSGLGVAP